MTCRHVNSLSHGPRGPSRIWAYQLGPEGRPREFTR